MLYQTVPLFFKSVEQRAFDYFFRQFKQIRIFTGHDISKLAFYDRKSLANRDTISRKQSILKLIGVEREIGEETILRHAEKVFPAISIIPMLHPGVAQLPF